MTTIDRCEVVVVVGGSAGAIPALRTFLAALDPDLPVAVVVALHRPGDRASRLDAVLGRDLDFTVREIVDGEPLCRGTVHVAPPGAQVLVGPEALHVVASEDPTAGSGEIDRLMVSAADSQGERVVAIILSGSSRDGSAGAVAVRDVGGLVLTESESSTAFPAMPRYAVSTGAVTAQLQPRLLAEAVGRFVRGEDAESIAHTFGPPQPPTASPPFQAALETRFRISLQHYKQSLVERRREERMAQLELSSVADYESYALAHPEELEIFFRSLLIGTTRFFRARETEPGEFGDLLADLAAELSPNAELRCWVAGCATGEEAYSLAMLLEDLMERDLLPGGYRIEATDIHPASLDTARRGSYDADRIDEIPAPLRRFVTLGNDHFEIADRIRVRVQISRHDLLAQSPLDNVDLVSCRNLLIYLTPRAQRKAVSLFRFSLRRGGLLILGDAETPGDLTGFKWVDRERRVLRKEQGVPRETRAALPPIGRTSPRRHETTSLREDEWAPAGTSSRPPDLHDRLRIYDQLLDRFMPPAFLVDRRGELIEAFGSAKDLVEIGPRRPSLRLSELLGLDDDGPLPKAILEASERPRPLDLEVHLPRFDGEVSVRIVPLSARSSSLLVLVDPDHSPPPAEMALLESLSTELDLSRREIDRLAHQLSQSTEELRSANEELVVSNEELRTGNEELHRVNLELEEANEECTATIRRLRQMTHDLSALLGNTNVGALFLGRNFEIRMFTEAAGSFFGLVQDDLGREFTQLAPSFQEIDFRELLHDARDRGRRYQSEVHDPQGRAFLLDVAPASPTELFTDEQSSFLDPDEEIVPEEGFLLTLVDLRSLVEVRREAERLAALVQSSTEMIAKLDLDGNVVYWNRGAEWLLGTGTDDILGRPLAELCLEADRPRLEELRQQAVEQKTGGDDSLRFRTSEGRWVILSLSVSPVWIGGELVGTACLGRDVTSRRLMERNLRDSEERLHDLYENAPDLHASIDPHNGTVVECNHTLLATLGLARDEILDRPATTICAPDSVTVLGRALDDLAAHREVRDRRMTLRREDGSGLPVSLNMSAAFGPEGGLELCRAVWRDIRQLQATELHLRREIDRREQFLAMLSHELRNPLNAVATAVSVLSREDAGADARKRAATGIERQTGHLRRLLDDLLDVSRISQNKLKVELAPIDLRQPLQSALDATRPVAEEDGVRIEATAPEDPVIVAGDRDRLQQLISNLLNNAIKFSRDGDGRVGVELLPRADDVVLRVKDNGPGIPPALKDSVFDLFVQSDRTLDRAQGGMGVGLTLVRAISELHGGSVRLGEGDPDSGATLEVRLPLADEGPPPEPEVESSPPESLHVLIIEDLADSREALETILELAGHSVRSAEDGSHGLRLAGESPPDLLLCDIGLPGLDGYEVMRRVRADDRLREVKAIALTGYGASSDVEAAEEAGFDLHLTKPLRPDELDRAISRLFG